VEQEHFGWGTQIDQAEKVTYLLNTLASWHSVGLEDLDCGKQLLDTHPVAMLPLSFSDFS
jgi:hypothetical protein